MMPQEVLDSLSVEHRAEQWRTRLTAPTYDESVFVAEVGGEIVGLASCGAARDEDALDGAGELEAVYILPEHWGQGIGRALLDRVEDWLRAAGHPIATLWVLIANQPARRFYEASGWTCEGTEQMYERDGHEIPEVRYVRDLSAAPSEWPG
jgi:GNAT superfamily N-acetyltransferase